MIILKKPIVNKFYSELGEFIITQYLDNYRLLENYFDIAPYNYSWKNFMDRLCYHYETWNFEEKEYLKSFESINNLIRDSNFDRTYFSDHWAKHFNILKILSK